MKKIIFIIILAIFYGCSSRQHIIDYYYLYDNEFGHNIMMCKLGCENDLSLEFVDKVYWNENLAVIIQDDNLSEAKNYYILIASMGTLKCCCRDKLMGPMKKGECIKELKLLNINSFSDFDNQVESF